MKLYIIEKVSKDGNEYKRAVIRAVNDLTGEEVYFSGFVEEFTSVKKWGENGSLLMFAELSRDKPFKPTAKENK